MRARTQPGAACHRIIDDRQPPIFCHTDPKRPAESARRTVASRPRKDRRTVCKAVLRSRPGFRQLRDLLILLLPEAVCIRIKLNEL